jgi:hypothetical protein
MPIENLYIARVTDGLILVPILSMFETRFNFPKVASMEHNAATGTNEKMEGFKTQVVMGSFALSVLFRTNFRQNKS